MPITSLELGRYRDLLYGVRRLDRQGNRGTATGKSRMEKHQPVRQQIVTWCSLSFENSLGVAYSTVIDLAM